MTGERLPPAVDRGPRRDLGPRARALVDRAAGLDRAAEGRSRLEQVTRADARARRRGRLVAVAVWSTGCLTAMVAGAAVRGVVGAGAGLLLVVVVAAVRRLLDRAAARRGASAWDWRARRYRLTGNPSAEVQGLDGYTGSRDALGQRTRPTR